MTHSLFVLLIFIQSFKITIQATKALQFPYSFHISLFTTKIITIDVEISPAIDPIQFSRKIRYTITTTGNQVARINTQTHAPRKQLFLAASVLALPLAKPMTNAHSSGMNANELL